MRDIFISHNSKDEVKATEIRDHLHGRNPEDRHWLSSDPDAGPIGGEDWQAWIHRRLSLCDVLLLVATKGSTSPWCSLEVGVAQFLQKPIIPVLVDTSVLSNPIVARYQAVDATQSFERVGLAVDRHLPPSARHRVPVGFVPYSGLDPLDEASRMLLAGREVELGRLLDDFEGLARKGGLVVISGSSGGGKSSLVSAGLLPELRERRWDTIGPFHPLKIMTADLPSLEEQVVGGRPNVVVLDQAEEMLQLNESEIDELSGWLQSHIDDGHSVIVIIRSEFRSAIGDRLPNAIDHHVNTLSNEHLEEVIRLPARYADLTVDDALVDRLVDETGSGAALPLLAYTLKLLWERRDRVTNALKPQVLDDLGGVAGVVNNQAERALRNSSGGDSDVNQDILAVLSRLATPNQNPTTRSPERAAMFSPIEREWLDEFVEVGLVSYRTAYAPDLDDSTSSIGPSGDRLVDVTHEKLFYWPTQYVTTTRRTRTGS